MPENVLRLRQRSAVSEADASFSAVSSSRGVQPALELLQNGAWTSPSPERADLLGELEEIGAAVLAGFGRHEDECRADHGVEPDDIEPDDDAQLWKTRSGDIDRRTVRTPLVESAFEDISRGLSSAFSPVLDGAATWGRSAQSAIGAVKERWF